MKYDQAVLRKMQETQLEIYKEFERLCHELNLPFFVTYGAVIGAVRHEGFIPWDDDIDVGMLREDYNKLIAYMQENPHPEYQFITPETQEGCVLCFGKFSKNGTECVEAAHSYRKYKSGIAIDVFPYDATSVDIEKRKKHGRDAWIWNRIMVLAEYPVPTLPDNMNPLLRSVCLIVCKFIHYAFKIIGLDRKKAYALYLKNATRYKNEEHIIYTDFSDFKENVIIEKSDLYPCICTKFEDTTIEIMNQYVKYLEQFYGDYMTLPPEDQRHNHPPKYVDFGDGFVYGEKE